MKKISLLGFNTLLCFLLVSCATVEPIYIQQTLSTSKEPVSLDTLATIKGDNQIELYLIEGAYTSYKAPFYLSSNYEGFEIKLPPGVYRVFYYLNMGPGWKKTFSANNFTLHPGKTYRLRAAIQDGYTSNWLSEKDDSDRAAVEKETKLKICQAGEAVRIEEYCTLIANQGNEGAALTLASRYSAQNGKLYSPKKLI